MLYAILKSFLIPPGIIILLLGGALLATRGVLSRLMVFTALSLVALMSLPVVAISLTQPLESFPPVRSADTLTGAQAILILGGGRVEKAPDYEGQDTLDDSSLRRVRYGAKLHRLTGLPIYVTGGRLPGEGAPVGQLMADVLRSDYGIQVAGAELESRSTWENAAYSAPLLARDGVRHVLLVSDALHLPRAVEACELAGLEVTPAPTAFVHHPGWTQDLDYRDWLPSTRAFQESSYAVHEHLGRVWYQVRTWIEGVPTRPPVVSAS